MTGELTLPRRISLSILLEPFLLLLPGLQQAMPPHLPYQIVAKKHNLLAEEAHPTGIAREDGMTDFGA
eukprot:CAMPEP_0183759168 /NCGR_PEP_ID=MMETSP0739-20130205/6912_1 /TAXON_ID=385413 /ORGANISM="Thalassiosira miniscula, Strain CCMP1093" /LENGTH=67 /DNA_ID=CAMNT_0025996903 /DNA_START=540 /DNA_END=743 /DNA_ORIENTATION=-